MVNIDDLADERTMNYKTPGENFRRQFLASRPVSQWPSYLDQTVVDILWDIDIGGLNLTRQNFGRECGEFYRQGLETVAGSHSDVPSALNGISDSDLGDIAFQLNELENDLREEADRSETSFDDLSRAIEAVLNKLLTATGEEQFALRVGGNLTSGAELLLRLFSDPTLATHADTVVDQFQQRVADGLLAAIDEPQMTTPLWLHQRDAIESWHDADRRGYANMATATGKTVLGLAAIASKYGQLHPLDEDVRSDQAVEDDGDVLIVAHDQLILEQWREEFDRHLDIPPERTDRGDDVDLEWGSVHFRTPGSLERDNVATYDLVIFDEAHHYVSESGWGRLLDGVEGDVLALSGSIDAGSDEDDSVSRRLERTIGTEIKEYTLSEAQADGVVPEFDWSIRYAPVGDDLDAFAELTTKAEEAYNDFRNMLRAGEFDVPRDRDLVTYDGIRRFAQTNEGRTLASENDTFGDLSSALRSRRTARWNLSPALDALVDVAVEYADKRTIVLVNSNAQVDILSDRLRDEFGSDLVFTVTSSQVSAEQRATIDEFDEGPAHAVLVGTGKLLGEGTDIPNAELAINMATGGVNATLIQRIGRVLRNPDGDSEATFVNVVGVLDREAATVPREDGRRLLENVAKFRAFGDRFGQYPRFESAGDRTLSVVSSLADAGYEWIDDLRTDDRAEQLVDEDGGSEEALADVLSAVTDNTGEELLAAWSGVDERTGPAGEDGDESAAPARPPEETDDSLRSVRIEVDVPTDNVVGSELYLETPDDDRIEPDEWSIVAKSLDYARLRAEFSAPPGSLTFGVVTPQFSDETTVTVE